MAEAGNAPASGVVVDPGTERNGGGTAAPTDAGGQRRRSEAVDRARSATRRTPHPELRDHPRPPDRRHRVGGDGRRRGREGAHGDHDRWPSAQDDDRRERQRRRRDIHRCRRLGPPGGDAAGRHHAHHPHVERRKQRRLTRTYGDYEMENRYSPEGEHVQDVRRDAEQTTVHDPKDGQLGRSTSFPTLGSAESAPPTPPAPPGPTAQRPAAPASPASPAASPSFRPPAGGGMSQVDMGDVEPQLPPDLPAQAEPQRPAPRAPSLGGGMSQIEDLGESPGTASP